MENLASPYATPCIVALCFKLCIFFIAKKKIKIKQLNPWFLALLISSFALNFFEFAIFCFVDKPKVTFLLLKFYYFSGASMSICLVWLAANTINKVHLELRLILLLLMSEMLILIFWPGLIILGVKPMGDIITAVRGPAYWIIPIIILSCSLMSLIILISGIRPSADTITKKRSMTILTGLIPLLGVVLAVFLALKAGVEMNGAGIISLAITWLILTLIYSARQDLSLYQKTTQ